MAKSNPADGIKDTMWTFLMSKGQKANIPSLKEYVYDLQRQTVKKDISWDELEMTMFSIIIEATALVLSGELDKLEGENQNE